MANDVELQIVLKLLDQATGDIKRAMGQIKNDTDQVGQAGDKAGKTIKDQFRAANTQLRDFRRAMLLAAIPLALIVKTTNDWGKKNAYTNEALKSIKSTLTVISEQIGSVFAPSIVAIGEALRRMTPGIIKFFDHIRTGWQSAVAGLTKFYQGVIAFDAYLAARANSTGQLDIAGAWSAAMNVGQAAADDITRKMKDIQTIKETLMPADLKRTGWQGGLDEMLKELRDFKTMASNIVKELGTNMKSMFSDLFYNTFLGDIKSAQEAFEDFGKSIIRSFSNAMAQVVTSWLWMKAVTGLGSLFSGGMVGTKGGSGSVGYSQLGYVDVRANTVSSPYLHHGGVIKAHSGLALDEVPIIAKSGERVLSREQNRDYENGGKGGLTINVNPVIQLWDASDVSRNNRTLVNAINEAIINNQAIRRVIRDYA